jgi:radical SAM superfamily enzyme YgiQ (UPF0313 family)
MRVLIIQYVPPGKYDPTPQFQYELGVSSALMRGSGFEPALLAVNAYRPERLRRAVEAHRPSAVVMDLPPTSASLARPVIMHLAEKFALPVILVGSYATCLSEQAVSMSGVSAIIVGQYEPALLKLLEALREGGAGCSGGAGLPEAARRIPGVWSNGGGGPVRNDPAEAVQDPDSLPWPDRDLFEYQQVVQETGQAAFTAVRGCEQWCSFCLNDWYMDLYAGKGAFPRRRSVANLLAEVQAVRQAYAGIRELAFTGHGFAADGDWLAEFAEKYARQVRLPYRCHVRLNRIDERAARMLSASGCAGVTVELGSGSNFIREEVLTMDLSLQQILAGIAALHSAGLAIRGRVFVGAPYESQVSLEETLRLLSRCHLEQIEPRVFFPIPGTRSAEMCAENGWLSGRGEESFHANRSVLDMPSFPAGRINETVRKFDSLLRQHRGQSLRAWLVRLKKLGKRPLHLFGRRKRRKQPLPAPPGDVF